MATDTTNADADQYRCTIGADAREEWADVEGGAVPESPADYREMFELLREQNIVTVEGDSCCGSCAHYEAGLHGDSLKEEGLPVAGRVCYHVQSAERGFDSMYLGYGGDELPDEAIAGMVMHAAQKVGLKPEWDGSTHTSVLVERE